MSLLHRLGALATALLALASCTAEDPIVQQLSIAPLASDTLYTGRSYQLEVRTTPEVDAPRLSWSVSDASLASIQYGGLLKPLASGEVTVYVTSLNSGGQRVASCFSPRASTFGTRALRSTRWSATPSAPSTSLPTTAPANPSTGAAAPPTSSAWTSLGRWRPSRRVRP